MAKFTVYRDVVKLLTEAQDAEEDNRALVKEDHKFIDDENGQWEQEWFNALSDQPRYSFDQTSPIVDQIAGDIEESDFDIKIDPAGGEATEDQAELRDGMIRNIENISHAQKIYSNAGRNVATGGFDAWLLKTDFVDDNSFDQDILIQDIHNAWDRVWFDVGSQEQDRSDSNYGFLLSSIPKSDFDKSFPGRNGSSVSDGARNKTKCNNVSIVTIGHIFYRKLKDRVLVQTSLGRVFEEKEMPKLMGPEVVEAKRTVKDSVFYMRKFDGDGFLAKEEETVFSTIPLVAVYGNFKVIDNETQYRGVVRKLKDPQRVYNYAKSREIAEGALAPRAKFWMTGKQMKGHETTLRTLNTNHDPVQKFNADPAVPGVPQQTGGAAVNTGLNTTAQTMRELMGSTAGIFAAGMGDTAAFAQSGVAIDKLQDKSNNITTKYFGSIEVGVCYTAKLANDAMHKVYDTKRMQRIMSADGSFEMKEINNGGGFDENEQPIPANDLTAGKYDITCKAGPSYDSRQSETHAAIMDIAATDPSVMALALDVVLKSSKSPGMDKIADRARVQLINSGVIPEDQMTEEEIAMVQQAAANRAPDPAIALAEAEMAKAQAQSEANQVALAKAEGELTIKAQQLELKNQELALKGREQEIKIAEKSAKLNLDAEKQEFSQMMEVSKQNSQMINDAVKNLNMQADTFGKIVDAMGVDGLTGPGIITAAIEQAEQIKDAQETT